MHATRVLAHCVTAERFFAYGGGVHAACSVAAAKGRLTHTPVAARAVAHEKTLYVREEG